MDLKIDGVVYNLTAHAKHRMNKRGVSMDDLVAALSDIKYSRTQETRQEEVRILYTGRNRVSVVATKDTNVIITVYNYNKEYYANKTKHNFNKKRRHLKKMHGNRLKK